MTQTQNITQQEISPGARRRRPTILGSTTSAVVPVIITIAVIIAIWEIAVDVFEVPSMLLPAPSAIAAYIVSNSAALWTDTAVTLWETMVAFVVSIVIAVPLGILSHRSKLFSRTIYPLLVGSQAFPKLALGPLFIVWFGFGTMPIILLAVLLTFFPITLNTILGLRAVSKESVELARMINLSRWSTFIRIEVPQALPSVFAGLRIASALAVVGVVVGEFLGTNAGLGYRIVNSTATADTESLFASLVILALFGAVVYGVVAIIERVSLPWHRPNAITT